MTTVKLQNLDCANCAEKIEKRLNELDELSNVKLNFATSTLSFEQKSEKNLLDKIENEIQKIEKQVVIIKDETKKNLLFCNQKGTRLTQAYIGRLVEQILLSVGLRKEKMEHIC